MIFFSPALAATLPTLLTVAAATSSSVLSGGLASRVIDGKDGGGQWESKTCAHTKGDRAQWILLDLGAPAKVGGLRLVGQNAHGHSKGWTIRVGDGEASDKICKANVDASGGLVVTVMCETAAATGRYITMSSPTTMVLCEAEVLAYEGAPHLTHQLAH